MMNQDEINRICEECARKTRISYKYDGRFFEPRFRKINHMQLGKSKLLTNPIVIVIEWFYNQYKNIRAGIKAIDRWLFPRRPKIWCHREDSALVGRIHYADRSQLDKPIHSLKVEFWGRTFWWQWRKLGEGFSADDGTFSIPFDLRQARNWRMRSAFFEIYQTAHAYIAAGKPTSVYVRYYKEKVPISNLTGMRYNLRTKYLHLWEYREDTPVPRVEIRDPEKDAPQYPSDGRRNALYQQVIPFELIKQAHLLQIEKSPETITLQSIQDDYPENLTVCIEKALPGYTRSDEWFGRRMMNGMNRGSFYPDKDNPQQYWIRYFGVCNYDHHDLYALPTTEIKFRLGADGLPLPIEIHLTGPLNAFNKDPWQRQVFTPESGDNWLYAKRIARVAGAVCTEVDEHFTGTHLNTEQYAIAAYRNLRRSPLSNLLFPHLKEVSLINHSADNLLIHGYIPSATALTEKGLHQRTYDIMGMQDWKNWKPMKVLSEAHTCARAEQLFWNIVTAYVDQFFEENRDEIIKYWYEVYYFSQDLTSHSVPVYLSGTDLNSLSDEARELAKTRFEYYCYQYGFDPDAPRDTINGELKAVSPLTKHKVFDQASKEDWQHAKDACSYMIMVATYLHTWINEHQYDDLGEILYSCGGLRFGDKPSGVLAPESDLSIAQDRTRATQMLWFTNFLSRTEYGFIMKNEEGDVNPVFSEMLQAHKDEFEKLGVDINAIESRTNI